MTLKRKLETGFAAFIRQLGATVLENYTGYEASEMKQRVNPGWIVKASGETECFEGGSPRNVTLEIAVLTQMDDNERGEVPSDGTRQRVRAQHDEALAAIETALEAPGAPAALKAFLNPGAAKRPVSSFYFYDLTKTDEHQNYGDRIFADSLTFEVVCQNCDG